MNAGDSVSVQKRVAPRLTSRIDWQRQPAGTVPTWLRLNLNAMNGSVVSEPTREDVTGVDLNEQLIVEFYSR